MSGVVRGKWHSWFTGFYWVVSEHGEWRGPFSWWSANEIAEEHNA